MRTSGLREGIPLHHQISTQIKDGIASGKYRRGDRLPSEGQLGESYAVSRVTVRRALQSLQDQGLIERRNGSGTFVTEKARVINMPTPIAPYLAQVAERRRLSRFKVEDFGFVPAPHDVATSLQIEEGDDVLRVTRVRVSGKLPTAYSTLFLPAAIGHGLTRKDFERQALSELLNRQGQAYARIDMVTRASLATPHVAGLLDVETGSALVDVQRIGYDAADAPIEFQRIQGPSDRFETHVTIEGPAAIRHPVLEPS